MTLPGIFTKPVRPVSYILFEIARKRELGLSSFGRRTGG